MSNFCEFCQRFFSHEIAALVPTHHRYENKLAAIKLTGEYGCQLCTFLWQAFSETERTEALQFPGPLDTVTMKYYTSPNCMEVYFAVRGSTIAKEFRLYDLSNLEAPEKMLLDAQLEYSSCDSGSAESLEMAAGWVRNCIKTHTHCNVASTSMRRCLPTRLLQISPIRNDTIKLCYSESLPPDTKYTTLSHCWGKTPLLTMTSKNIQSLQTGISLTELPKTFRDAIHVTRTFKVSYIWIDSLCIIQDSKEDWLKESLRMAGVYSFSYCNIAATNSSSSTGGCFVSRPVHAVQPRILSGVVTPKTSRMARLARHFKRNKRRSDTIEVPKVEAYLIRDQLLWYREVTLSVLLSRGWVMQERLLSPRVLHFGASQVFFECRQFCASELYPSGCPSEDLILTPRKQDLDLLGLNLKHKTLAERVTAWSHIVELFMSCSLTYESDLLVAIAGVARLFRSFMRGRYVARLWEDGLVRQLVWGMAYQGPFSLSPEVGVLAEKKPPSWSWASRLGGVGCVVQDHVYRECVKVEGIEIETLDDDEYSPAVSGRLTVVARLFAAEVVEWQDDFMVRVRDMFFHYRRDLPVEESDGRLFAVVCLANPSSYYGIVLQATGNRGEYRRIGMFLLSPIPVYDKHIVALWERQTAAERAVITDDYFEKLEEETDLYTFTIV